jgi:2-methylcitrate dehydratase
VEQVSGAGEPGDTAIARLAAWVCGLRAEDFSARAIERAKLLLLDTLACGFAAHGDDTAQAVLAALDALGEAPQCTVLSHGRRMSAPSAVLANGTLIRVLDLNDYVVGAHPQSGVRGGHPSDNIPVALAAAELFGASGRALLAAIVLAYEIYGRGKALMEADSPWDGISVSGLVAPAVAGWLMRLPGEEVAHAIALSAARAPTPVAVREGDISAAKSIANALIAQNGMQAVLLAANGVTGPLDLFEAERGLKAVFPRAGAGDVFAAPLPDDSWPDDGFIMRTAIKAYPCFAGGQSAVAAALALHRLIDGDIERLKTVRVALADLPVVRRWLADRGRTEPQSREAADHSLHFLIAVALIDGAFGLAQFDRAHWTDPAVRALMARLDMTTDADLTRRAGGAYPCALHATGHDGKRYDIEIPQPPGFSADGLDAKTVLDKFVSLTESRLTESRFTPDRRDRIVAAVMELDGAPSCAGLMSLLAAAAP